jgi:hypothetical protein
MSTTNSSSNRTRLLNLGAFIPMLLLAPLSMAESGCGSAIVGDDCPRGTACAGAANAGSGDAGGAANAGNGDAGGTHAGSANAGDANAGDANAGTAGDADAGAGGAATAGAGGAAAGAGGAAAGAGGGGACADETVGSAGAPGAGAVTTAVVLVDDVVVSGSNAPAWHFADAAAIADGWVNNMPPANKWARVPYAGPDDPLEPASDDVSTNPGAQSSFLACDGFAAIGSQKNVIPFTAAHQYYTVSVVFPPTDYSGKHVSAKVKLVSGSSSVATCPVQAVLAGIGTLAAGGTSVGLAVGVWKDVALDFPATDFTTVTELQLTITTYGCSP